MLLIGALFLSSCGCIKETKEEPKEVFGGEEMKIPPGWEVYENKEWGIRVAYPPKVEVVKSKTPGGALWIDFKIELEDKKLGDMLSIGCKKTGENFGLASYAAHYSGVNVEDLEDITIGGKPGKIAKNEVGFMPGEPLSLNA